MTPPKEWLESYWGFEPDEYLFDLVRLRYIDKLDVVFTILYDLKIHVVNVGPIAIDCSSCRQLSYIMRGLGIKPKRESRDTEDDPMECRPLDVEFPRESNKETKTDRIVI